MAPETGFSDGVYGVIAPNPPGVPTFSVYGIGTITFTFDDNENDDTVEYAIYNILTSKYVALDGGSSDTEVWGTYQDWNDGVVIAAGITARTAYTFKAIAKNVDNVLSDWTAASAQMHGLPAIDWGDDSININREVTSGNTKASISKILGFYGDISITFKLMNNRSDVSSMVIEFAESVDIANPSASSWHACTDSGGDSCGLVDLASSPSGEESTFIWDSYPDAGLSEYNTAVCIRIRPKDVAGDAGSYAYSPLFTVDNRPVQIYVVIEDGYTFDKIKQPVFLALLGEFRGGTALYHKVSIVDATNTEVTGYPKDSSVDQVGWSYGNDDIGWTALDYMGVPYTAIDETQYIRFIPPVELPVGVYTIKMTQGEVRERGV